MAYMNVLHGWNAKLGPPVGFLLNALLIWLILRRTPKEMRVHSRILLQTCAMDMCFLLTMLLGNAIFIRSSQQDEVICVYSGWLLRPFELILGPYALIWRDLAWSYLYYFIVHGIPVQFVYRYLVLNRNIHIGPKRYLTMLSVVAIAVSFLTFAFFGYSIVPMDVSLAASDTNSTLYLLMADSSMDVNDPEMSFYLVTVVIKLTGWLYTWTFLYVCSYAIIIFCAWRMNRFLNTHANVNANLKSLNKQLTLNMLFLASIPVLLGCLDLGLTYFNKLIVPSSSDDAEQQVKSLRSAAGVQMFANLVGMWVPSLNALVSIVVNRPYRKAVFSFCPCAWCQMQSQHSSAVVPAAAGLFVRTPLTSAH